VKDTVGLMLLEAWKKKGKFDCHHPEFHKERSFSGTVTGCYICTICGQLMPMERVQTEVKRMSQIL
jgi:hypothetical protein